MKEQLISFETAKLAKEKGFQFEYDENSPDEYGDGKHSYFEHRNSKNKSPLSHYYFDTNQNCQQWNDLNIPAPTQSLLQRWLRERHNLNIGMVYFNFQSHTYWEYRVHYKHIYGNRKTYEEALEKALQEALGLITLPIAANTDTQEDT